MTLTLPVDALRGVCASTAWVDGVLARGPFPDAEALLRAADDVLAGLTETDVDEALAGHPRIGDRAAAAHSASSAREQAGVTGADAQVLADLAAENAAYEERFGHVYLVCASGRSAAELLAVLRERLGNDPATERRVLRRELAAINRLRLLRLLPGSTLSTHVLDATTGLPAAGVAVRVEGPDGPLAEAVTDDDGRVRPLTAEPVTPGTYRLVVATGAWFAARGVATFYPEVVVTFSVTGDGRHLHVPLLLSPFAYSTYRGS